MSGYGNLLNNYGKLKGEEIWLPCLWHTEEKPSLTININTGIFHCFGCRESGTIEKLVAAREGLSIIQAREFIHDRCGDQPRQNRMRVRQEFHGIDSEKFESYFPVSSKPYIDYLKKRAISKGWAEKFNLREGSPLQTVWNKRIIYAIRNVIGKIVSMEGRTVNESSLRYYKEEGSRSNLGLFGIERLEKVKEKLWIVEGAFDAISMSVVGKRAVAMCCSMLSQEQLAQLSRYTDYPIVLLDGVRPGTEDERAKVAKEIKDRLARRFSRYKVLTIAKKQTDPNDLLRKGQLKDYLKKLAI